MRKIISALILGAASSAALGGAALAQASPATQEAATVKPALDYHWCPGEFWNPIWGFNWEGGACHDDNHRDRDGDDHSRDFGGDHRGGDDRRDDGDHRGDGDHHDDGDHRGGDDNWNRNH